MSDHLQEFPTRLPCSAVEPDIDADESEKLLSQAGDMVVQMLMSSQRMRESDKVKLGKLLLFQGALVLGGEEYERIVVNDSLNVRN